MQLLRVVHVRLPYFYDGLYFCPPEFLGNGAAADFVFFGSLALCGEWVHFLVALGSCWLVTCHWSPVLRMAVKYIPVFLVTRLANWVARS